MVLKIIFQLFSEFFLSPDRIIRSRFKGGPYLNFLIFFKNFFLKRVVQVLNFSVWGRDWNESRQKFQKISLKSVFLPVFGPRTVYPVFAQKEGLDPPCDPPKCGFIWFLIQNYMFMQIFRRCYEPCFSRYFVLKGSNFALFVIFHVFSPDF